MCLKYVSISCLIEQKQKFERRAVTNTLETTDRQEPRQKCAWKHPNTALKTPKARCIKLIVNASESLACSDFNIAASTPFGGTIFTLESHPPVEHNKDLSIVNSLALYLHPQLWYSPSKETRKWKMYVAY